MNHIHIIGQAPPLSDPGVPYKRTRLWNWMSKIGLTFENTVWTFDAVLEEFPGTERGGHRAPTKTDIERATERLWKRIDEVSPDVVVTLGIPGAHSLCPESRFGGLDELVGRSLLTAARLVPIVALPHPSGRSSWVYSSENRHRALQRALECLSELCATAGSSGVRTLTD